MNPSSPEGALVFASPATDGMSLAKARQIPIWAYVLVIVVGIWLVLPLADDFGSSWDVEYCESRGLAAYIFYFGGFDGAKYLSTPLWTPHYGPLVDVLIKIFQDMTSDPVRKFDIRVWIQAAISLSALIPLFLIAMRIISRPLALIAVALVAATPVFFGHSFVNPKDSIFASGYLWLLYIIIACFADGRRPSYWALVGFGILLGVVTSIRYVGAYLILLGLFAEIILPALRPLKPGEPKAGGADEANTAAKGASFRARLRLQARNWGSGLGVLFFSSLFAYVLSMPLLLAALQTQTLFGTIHKISWGWYAQIRYFGDYIWVQKLPWHYLYGYMLVQLPLYYHFFLLVYLASLIAQPRIMVASFLAVCRNNYKASSTLLILLLAIVIPIITMLVGRPVVYDGFRHVLFMVPLICILLYLAFLQAIAKMRSSFQIILCLIGILLLAEPLVSSKNLHPYEYVYFNPLVGAYLYVNPSVKEEDLFDVEYLVTSYRELAPSLNDYARERGKKIRIFIDGPIGALTPFIDSERFEVVTASDNPDLIVGYNRWGSLDRVPKPWLVSVSRGNTVFAAAGVIGH